MSDSLWPHGLWPTRLLCPWNFPGKIIEVSCYFFLQGIFPTQRSNLHLLHCRQIFNLLGYQESPIKDSYTFLNLGPRMKISHFINPFICCVIWPRTNLLTESLYILESICQRNYCVLLVPCKEAIFSHHSSPIEIKEWKLSNVRVGNIRIILKLFLS